MGMSIRHFTVKDGGKLALCMHRIEAVMQSEINGNPVTLIVTGSDTYGVTERYEFVLAAWCDAIKPEPKTKKEKKNGGA